jgi:hypothetical protein
MSEETSFEFHMLSTPPTDLDGFLVYWQTLKIPVSNGRHIQVDLPSKATADDIDQLIKHLGLLKESVA